MIVVSCLCYMYTECKHDADNTTVIKRLKYDAAMHHHIETFTQWFLMSCLSQWLVPHF